MTNNKRTRKDIIKNVAIVFLTIMLILTFFSNTIMNWSLAQVSGKYTEYGEIKTGVRGSGTVVANFTYTESVKNDSTIKELYVTRGTRVEQGTPLMLLSASNGDKAETLRGEIKSLEESYERALMQRTEYDYTSDEMAIKNATEDLNELLKEREKYSDDYVEKVKLDFENNEKALKEAKDLVESLTLQLEEIAENSEDEQVVLKRADLKRAKEAYDIALEAFEKAEEEFSKATYIDTDSYQSSLSSLYDSLDALETELRYLKEDSADLIKIDEDLKAKERALNSAIADHDKAISDFGADSDEAKAAKEAEEQARAEYDAALLIYNSNKDEVKNAIRSIEAKEKSIDSVEGDIRTIRQRMSNASSENREYESLKKVLDIKKKALDTEKENLDIKQKEYDTLVEKITGDLTLKLKDAKNKKETLEKDNEKLNEELSNVAQVENLDEQIKNEKRSLEQMTYSLEKRKESDKKSKELEDYDLGKQYRVIQEKKEELAALGGESDKGTTLYATHSGVITEVNFKPGEFIPAGSSALVIEVEESGYTLNFTVTNKEAQKLTVGDTATVSNAYWGQNLGAVLKSIQPDSTGKNKILTFELDGNAEVGQNLTLTVGEKGTYYSAVVPKSAVHEDAEGKFVYVTKEKSTPLGTRYVATRLNVTIAATDDKNSAIVTDESYIYEYVITSSTKPFEAGDYVRLSD
ncbi:MAG: HlyD family efflux transporter periplasmic adaptor subunit [Ruminococcaceae bacterium]|nr:HlyD family efflux transporter periplasmic adaptor subunit [Oscillospiraceae bacterium]